MEGHLTDTAIPSAARDTFHHGDLRQALLTEAGVQLRAAGPDRFSLRETARAVGVSPAAAYRHFADKGALLAELAAQGFARLAAVMEDAMTAAGEEPVARLRANGRSYVAFALKEPALFLLMFGPFGAGNGEPVQGVGPRTGLTAFALLAQVLDDLVATGCMASKRRTGAESLMWSSVHGLSMLAAAGVLREPATLIYDNQFPLIRKGLGLAKNTG